MNNPHLMRNREIAKSTQRAVIGRLPKLRKIIYAPVDGPRQHIGATCSASAAARGAQHSTAEGKKKQTAEKAKQQTARSAGRMLAAATAGKNYKLMKFMHNKIASEIIDAVVHALNAP